MKDWKLAAAAQGLEVPEGALARMVTVMEALETDFRPLVEKIPLEVEPALTFACRPESEA